MQTYIIAALSADGFIAQNRDQASTDWTSPEDKAHFMARTKKSGALVMGLTTFATVGRPLPARKNWIYTSQSKPAMVKKFALNPGQTDLIEVTTDKPAALVQKVAAAGYQELAVCGGCSIYTQFMQAGVVDKLFLTIEPVIFGNGIPLFSKAFEQQLVLLNQERVNQQGTLFLEYELQTK
jgi:dihydrofolate reductase